MTHKETGTLATWNADRANGFVRLGAGGVAFVSVDDFAGAPPAIGVRLRLVVTMGERGRRGSAVEVLDSRVPDDEDGAGQ